MEKKIAVVLLSGGMDSALCAAIAKEEGYELAALHLNYKQKTQEKEYQSFKRLCDHYNIRYRLSVDVSYLNQIGGSSLTDEHMTVDQANLESDDIPTSYVPFRNANIMAIATSWAEVLGASALYVGAVEQDSSGYPDCRVSFFEAFQSVIDTGTKPDTHIEIKTPVIDLMKAEIVQKGHELGVPFEKTWSCYQNSEEACGECESCVLRLRGFKNAGLEDPIPYVKKK